MTLKKSLKIVQALHDAGYTAYYAGGWVRDYLLGIASDEVDIATSASPDEIEALFPKTVAIGKAFGVILVVFENESFEIATFRKDHTYLDGRHPEGVDFSTPEKDAMRRDFTINGMFFDPLTEEIHDYVNGQKDLKAGIIRAIGNPQERFAEDRLRMIRAVRFAARFGFRIEETTQEAIIKQANTLFPSVSMERIWQEFTKMASAPRFHQALVMLQRFGLLQTIFPQLTSTTVGEIEEKVSRLPENCPAIIYLLELLPEEGTNLCFYLKTSNVEVKLVEFFQSNPQTLVDWTYLYAHEFAPLWLKVNNTKNPSSIEEHQKRQKRLEKHIERVKNKTPLITAAHLKEYGVTPGEKMGQLLKQAETIAITEDINEPEKILSQLGFK